MLIIVVKRPDLMTRRRASSSDLSMRKIASMMAEKLLCRTLNATEVPTSATGAPIVIPMLDASSSELVISLVLNVGATKGLSSASSLSRRAVARPKVKTRSGSAASMSWRLTPTFGPPRLVDKVRRFFGGLEPRGVGRVPPAKLRRFVGLGAVEPDVRKVDFGVDALVMLLAEDEHENLEHQDDNGLRDVE